MMAQSTGSALDIYVLLTTAVHLTPLGVKATGLRCCPQSDLFHSGEHDVRHSKTQARHRPADTQYDVMTSSALGVTADISVSAGNVGQGGVMALSAENVQPGDTLPAANDTQYDVVTSSALGVTANVSVSADEGEQGGVMAPSDESVQPGNTLSAADYPQCGVVTSSASGVTADLSVSADNGEQGGILAPSPESVQPEDTA